MTNEKKKHCLDANEWGEWPLLTNEPIEFEKQLAESQNLRGIYLISLEESS